MENNIKKFMLLNTIIFLISIIFVFFMKDILVNNFEPQKYKKIEFPEKNVYLKDLTTEIITTDDVVNDFVIRSIVDSLSFEIDKLNKKDELIKNYFSDNGWLYFYPTLKDLRVKLKEENDVITSSVVILDDPILMNVYSNSNIKLWKYYVKPTLKIVGKGGISIQDYSLIMILSQVKNPKNIRGLAIDSFELK